MKRVNVVVVGAGAAGGIVAKELSTAGLSVVLLERGKWYTPNDCRKDDLRNQRTTVLGNAFGPEDDGNPRVVVDPDGGPQIFLPSEGGYQNNAACVGGGTLSYGAMAWRYLPQDFRMRSIYGAPAGSSLEDWPISYDDLEPYYEKAEYEIGISGDDSGTPFHGPRRRPLPMPPLPPNREFQILEPAAKRLGLHPFPIPMARNSVPYNGRGPFTYAVAGHGNGKGMQAEAFGCRLEDLKLATGRQRRHGQRTPARAVKGSGGIIAGDADLVFGLLVVRLQVVVGDGPVLERTSHGRSVGRAHAEVLRQIAPGHGAVAESSAAHAGSVVLVAAFAGERGVRHAIGIDHNAGIALILRSKGIAQHGDSLIAQVVLAAIVGRVPLAPLQ